MDRSRYLVLCALGRRGGRTAADGALLFTNDTDGGKPTLVHTLVGEHRTGEHVAGRGIHSVESACCNDISKQLRRVTK